MNLPLVTPDNAPRDAAGLHLLSRPKRYNLALAMALFPNESPEEQAFIAADDPTQVHALQAALQQWDAARGGAPQQAQQPPQQAQPQQYAQPGVPPQQQYAQPAAAPPPQAQAPGVPAPLAVTPQPLAVTPQQNVTPQQMPQQGYAQQGYAQQGYAPQPGVMPGLPPAPPSGGLPPAPQYAQQPPPQYAQQPQQPPPPQYAQQPQQALPPAPQAALPPAPMAAPPQAAPPGLMPPPAAPPQAAPQQRAPQTAGDPGNAGQATSQQAQINELKGIILGMARTQNMLTCLVLELTSHQLGADKQSLAALAVRNSLAGEPESLFEAAVTQGKAG